ncbi:CLUMA_CG013684, isoform B [Clunio marinus]|uniref:CLUMA_CG013684, isoform B n=1 Tax=Clunio marinus TaxID=568069 RepID=A0A1J1IPJ4_9DIPT|nr:CLUMA_CG013684, isoform B [Clunio marinus]
MLLEVVSNMKKLNSKFWLDTAVIGFLRVDQIFHQMLSLVVNLRLVNLFVFVVSGIGKKHPSHSVCYIPYGGRELSFSDCEVFTYK